MQTQSALQQKRPATDFRRKRSSSAGPDRSKSDSKRARDEIYAYAAMRDLLLSEAEKLPNAENVRRAEIANDFLENCLRPARPPYEAQYLNPADAAREREGCREAKARLGKLSCSPQPTTATGGGVRSCK